MSSLQDAASFVRSLKTWMDVRVTDGFVQIDTRDNGDVGDERAGKADIEEGKRVAKALREKFPEANVEFEIVDEWVSVMLDFAPKRYNSRELEAALKEAFHDAGRVYRTGGTYEIAEAEIPSIGAPVRLVSGREGGVELERGVKSMVRYAPGAPLNEHVEWPKGVRLTSLAPKVIRAAAKR